MALPHHIRFARTLALVSSLGASIAGCYDAHQLGREPVDSATPDGAAPDSARPDSAMVDAGRDTGLTCGTCECSWTTPPSPTSCEAAGLSDCCLALGPLAPPDLAA